MNARTPPGWYDDPQTPGLLRYWTGDEWSEHTSPPPPARAASQSGMSALGTWLGSCFSMTWARWAQLLPLFLLAVAAWIVTVALAVPVFDGVVVDGENVSGWDSGRTTQLLASLTVGLVLSGTVAMAVAHQIYFARLGVHQPVGASLGAAVAAIPRAIGWVLLIIGAMAFAAMAMALLFLVPVAGVVGFLVFVALMVFAAIKLAFLAPALVVPIPGRNPIEASAEVSNDRFWPVLGRLLLLGLIIGLGSGMLGTALQAFTGTSGEVRSDILRFDSDGGFEYADLGAIADELDPLSPGGVIVQIPGILASFVGIAGGAILFAERHQHRPAVGVSATDSPAHPS